MKYTKEEVINLLNKAHHSGRVESDVDFTVEIRECKTGLTGVADWHNASAEEVSVFYGADDGSDDKIISLDKFIEDFEITAAFEDVSVEK